MFFFGVLSFDDEILREDGMIAGFSSVSISIFTAIIFVYKFNLIVL